MSLSFLFFIVNVFDTASYVFLLDLISLDSMFLGIIPFILFPHPSQEGKTGHLPLFTVNTSSSSNDPPLMRPWIDATRPPHCTAMQWQYLRMISI